ncbi:hypothetical protein [Bacillus sp. AFS017336]|uniref:hypothetical protein n=1 Tax=Bacillus sp. AFS017336 TaxID=2033489 RepID=UPI000BF0380F|nr:hypothetical protein [Bacillus sp. AFS017336]PEL13333.1 hypothetical protein CN601_05625 [Bacillus sp. AFS017336]
MFNKIKSLLVILIPFYFLTAGNIKVDQSQSKDNEPLTAAAKDIKADTSTENDHNFTDNVKIVNSDLTFAVTYNDVNQLMKDSELAVEGVVLSTENYVYMDKDSGIGNPLTKLSLKINNVLKGDSSLVGKKITILE